MERTDLELCLAPMDACPLCRSSLTGSADSPCPSCGADLSQYRSLRGRGDALLSHALELLERGDLALATEVSEGLDMLVPDGGPALSLIRAKLALAQADWEGALEHATHLPADEREQIESAARYAAQNRRIASSLYNNALAACRQGEYQRAVSLLRRCTELDSGAPEAWSLMAKAALKASDWGDALHALAQLDRRQARPAILAGIEELLPAGW